MNVLMHVCCGPCTVYPLAWLRGQGHQVEGWFFNPNIHPYREFKRRISSLVQFAEAERFRVVIEREYDLKAYLRQVVFHEDERCPLCYGMRLEPLARRAAEQGYDAFTTTLLYSRYQQHRVIARLGDQLAGRFGVRFLYHDFREGWQQGIDGAIALGLYRQPYCGCIYSEQERYDKKLRRRMGRRRARERQKKEETCSIP